MEEECPLIVTSGKAGLNVPELHMPADYVSSQQINSLHCNFTLQNRENAALAASTVSRMPELFHRWLKAEWTVRGGLCGVPPQHRMVD